MSESPASGHIKGAALHQFLIWVHETVGEREFNRRFAGLIPKGGNPLNSGPEALGIVVSKWYDCLVIHRILDVLSADTSSDELNALTAEGSQAVIDHTLRGPYRTLFEWMANPKRYARHGSKIWSNYYDSGEFVIESDEEARRAVCTIRGWSSHHPILCDMNQGASTAIYRAMGFPDAHCVRETCVREGASECRFVTIW